MSVIFTQPDDVIVLYSKLKALYATTLCWYALSHHLPCEELVKRNEKYLKVVKAAKEMERLTDNELHHIIVIYTLPFVFSPCKY